MLEVNLGLGLRTGAFSKLGDHSHGVWSAIALELTINQTNAPNPNVIPKNQYL